MSQKRRSPRLSKSRKGHKNRRSRSRGRATSSHRARSSSRRRGNSSVSPKRIGEKDRKSAKARESSNGSVLSSDSDEDRQLKKKDFSKIMRSRSESKKRDKGVKSRSRSRSRRRKNGQSSRSRRRRNRNRDRMGWRRGASTSSSSAASVPSVYSSLPPEMMDSEQEEEWLEKRRKQRQEISKKHEEAIAAPPSPSAQSKESKKKSGNKRSKKHKLAPGTPAYIDAEDSEEGDADIFAPFATSPSPVDSPPKGGDKDEDARSASAGSLGRISKEGVRSSEKLDDNDVLKKLEKEDASSSESEEESSSNANSHSRSKSKSKSKEEAPHIVGGINISEIRKNLEKEKAKLRDFIRKTKNAYEEAEEQGQEEIDKVIADYNPDLREDWDDAEGYYKPRIGEIIDNKYKCFAECAGKGVFSNVVKANELTGEKRPVAIKIIRSNDMMKKAAEKEIDMLKTLNSADPEDRRHVVKLLHTFTYRNHLCLVFELMGYNVRQALKVHGKGRGLTLSAVHAYTFQLFIALRLIKKCGIVHADIKPDNMLIGGPEGKDLKKLKICDLGSGLDAKTECDITSYLVSRFYRAPEIMVGLPYDYAIDVWAVGCTLFELLTGKILFKGSTNNGMLKQIIEVCGGTSKMLRKGQCSKRHFTPEGNFVWEDRDTYSNKVVRREIKDLRPKVDIEKQIVARCRPEHKAKAKQLSNLIKKCLALDPKKRITPDEVFEHPFIKEGVPDIRN